MIGVAVSSIGSALGFLLGIAIYLFDVSSNPVVNVKKTYVRPSDFTFLNSNVTFLLLVVALLHEVSLLRWNVV